MAIYDARQIYGAANAQQVYCKWEGLLEQRAMSRVRDVRTVAAYVNHSRWVSDCPECNGAMGCWSELDTACCLGCGHEYAVTWPEDAATIEAVLLQRPTEASRSWNPGETIGALEA